MSLTDTLRATILEKIDERAKKQTELDAILTAPEAEARDLNSDEAIQFAELRDALKAIDAEIAPLEARVDELAAEEKRRDDIAARAKELGGLKAPAVVLNEGRTYRPDVQHGFLSDLFASSYRVGDYIGASERLQRHTVEANTERRDIGVAAVAGMIPPQYLVDSFAPLARAGRPFLNSLNSLPLPPEGVSFFIPRVTTGSAAAMTAEAAGFNEQDIAVTNDNPLVNLVTAQQDISRTMFMRGGAVVDKLIIPDLIGASEVALNTSAMNGSGTAPQHRGILNTAGISVISYTDATPTVGEAWPKFSDAIQRINSLRYMPGTAIYMHPRRWGWVTSAVDSTGRPLFNFTNDPGENVVGVGDAAKYGQVVGRLQGLPVITDATIPTTLGAGTNEDIILVVRTNDVIFWEDEVMQFVFEQTASTAPGQVRLAAGRFSMFHAGRYPTAISTIGGTGLITPAF